MNQHSMFRTLLDELRLRTDHDAQVTARRTEVFTRFGRVRAAAVDPALRAVVDLHQPVIEISSPWPACRGCDNYDGPDAEPPEWPCRTWKLIQLTVAP